jgi:DNA polymerase I-like protein with 3'-5' exonuclease and polymerase domains
MSIQIKVGDLEVPFDQWRASCDPLGSLIAVDTETNLIEEGMVPNLVVTAATNGKQGYFIANQSLTAFFSSHGLSRFLMHNAAFDLAVLDKAGFNTQGLVENGRVFDTGLLFKLIKLADEGFCCGAWSLDHVLMEHLKIALPKTIKAHDGQEVRLTFSRFLRDDGTPDYAMLAAAEYRVYLEYAAKDPIATWMIAQSLNAKAKQVLNYATLDIFDRASYSNVGMIDGANVGAAWKKHGFLTHDIQLKASIALAAIERRGMKLDTAMVTTNVSAIEEQIPAIQNTLESRYGWSPGKGSAKVFDRILDRHEKQTGTRLPRVTSESGKHTQKYSQKADDLEEYRQELPFIDNYLKFKELNKIKSTFLNKLEKAEHTIRGHFNVLVNSGRTSCSAGKDKDGELTGINLQNLPKPGKNYEHSIRECFVSREGCLLLDIDYSTLELGTLAQNCLSKFGGSKMADALKKGADLHCAYALQRDGVNLNALPSWDKQTLMSKLGPNGKEKREKAKPINFGFPGGLGAATLVEYARTNYGIEMTLEEAKQEKEHWFRAWPEMKQHLASDDLSKLASQYADLWKAHPGYDRSRPFRPSEIPWPVFHLKGILSGETCTRGKKKPYTEAQIQWAQRTGIHVAMHSLHIKPADRQALQTKINERIFDGELWSKLTPRPRFVATITGRLRGYPTYCAARNTPFQGLAADGAKLALYRLNQEGFRVVNFIHDEFLIEFPESADHTVLAKQVEQIMIEEMQTVVPDIPIKAEYALMRRWYKGAEAKYEDGKLVPVRPLNNAGKISWACDTNTES